MPSKLISIWVKPEVEDYYRWRAAQPNAAGYQTQMRADLEEAMKRDQKYKRHLREKANGRGRKKR
jgi:hypothetical protein